MNAKESPSASTSFSVSYLLQRPFFFFSFLPWSTRRLPLFLSSAYFSFSSDVLPFFSPSVEPKTFFSSAQHISFFFSFLLCFQLTFFLFQFSASFCCFCSACLSLFFSASLLLFYRHVALLSSAFYFFRPKLFWAQNTFSVFQPKSFLVFQPKCFSVFFPTQTFLLQFSHSSLLLFFSALFFSGSSLFFLFQHLLFFFSLAPFIQGPIFSLAASHLFYFNKYLFSSNLK